MSLHCVILINFKSFLSEEPQAQSLLQTLWDTSSRPQCETGVYDCGDLTMVADVEKRETLEYMSVKAIPALLCQPFICRLEFSPLLAATFLLAAIF